MDVLPEARWLPSLHNRRYQERETAQAIAMDLIDQYQQTYMCMLIIIRIRYI